MNKYFIEYPKNHIYVRFDGLDGFVNFQFKHDDNEYLFVEFVCRNSWLFSAFKKAKVLCTACDMPPLVPFSNINNMSTSFVWIVSVLTSTKVYDYRDVS